MGIFPVHPLALVDLPMLEWQMQAIQANLNRTYRDLLLAMVRCEAVQISLNGLSNKRSNPNENLGRELLELFSLGEGNYRESDVREAARALTGYQLDASRRLVLDPRRQDTGMKTILDRTAAFDAPSLVTWLCEQPATARHMAGRIWRRRVGPKASPQTLDALAAGWRKQKLSLPWLMGAIANNEEARARRGERLLDPVEMVVKSLRLLGSRHPEAIAISLRGLTAMGQPLLQPPSVKGWPENEQWLQLRWLDARRSTLRSLLGNEEVWETRSLPPRLEASLTPIPPLALALPAESNRTNLERLFTDPVWQLA